MAFAQLHQDCAIQAVRLLTGSDNGPYLLIRSISFTLSELELYFYSHHILYKHCSSRWRYMCCIITLSIIMCWWILLFCAVLMCWALMLLMSIWAIILYILQMTVHISQFFSFLHVEMVLQVQFLFSTLQKCLQTFLPQNFTYCMFRIFVYSYWLILWWVTIISRNRRYVIYDMFTFSLSNILAGTFLTGSTDKDIWGISGWCQVVPSLSGPILAIRVVSYFGFCDGGTTATWEQKNKKKAIDKGNL